MIKPSVPMKSMISEPQKYERSVPCLRELNCTGEWKKRSICSLYTAAYGVFSVLVKREVIDCNHLKWARQCICATCTCSLILIHLCSLICIETVGILRSVISPAIRATAVHRSGILPNRWAYYSGCYDTSSWSDRHADPALQVKVFSCWKIMMDQYSLCWFIMSVWRKPSRKEEISGKWTKLSSNSMRKYYIHPFRVFKRRSIRDRCVKDTNHNCTGSWDQLSMFDEHFGDFYP